MARFLLSAAAIFILLLATFLLPEKFFARSRCSVKMPETLLSLYQNSDYIYIASFDKTVEGEVAEDTEDYSAVNIKKHFSITSTLKGENRKFFVLDDQEYRYKNTAEIAGEGAEEVEEGDEVEDEEESAVLKPGDSLLLFLKNGSDGEAPTLTDYRDGTKKLSTDRIAVYEARIKELNSIFNAKKVSETQIIEWLIRCAEDPATRWEGTYELLQSFQNLEWQEEAAEQRKERIARGEPVEVEPESEEAEESEDNEITRKNIDTNAFAKLLSENQKHALANILLSREISTAENDAKTEKSVHGDRELIELVKRWGDPRLVGFLIHELRANSGEPYRNSQTMNTIAEILDDTTLSSLAEKYGEISDEEDAAEVEAEDETDDVAAADESAETESQSETDLVKTSQMVVHVTDAEVSEEDTGAEPEQPKKITYKELRDEILQKFLIRSEQVLAGIHAETESNSSG